MVPGRATDNGVGKRSLAELSLLRNVQNFFFVELGSEHAEFWWNCSESDKSMKFGPDIVHMVLIKIRSGGTPKIDFLTSY